MNKSNAMIVEYYNKWYVLSEDFKTLISPKGRVMKSSLKAWYYRFNSKWKWIMIHRFVAYLMYWDVLFSKWICVRHLNWNPLDNTPWNITIWTQKENSMDKTPETRLRAAKIASSFIVKHNHKEIYNYHLQWNSYKKIMKEFNISSKWTVSYIINSIKQWRNKVYT